jgi:hypothetical protein
MSVVKGRCSLKKGTWGVKMNQNRPRTAALILIIFCTKMNVTSYEILSLFLIVQRAINHLICIMKSSCLNRGAILTIMPIVYIIFHI